MTPSVKVNGVECIRYSTQALTLKQLAEGIENTLHAKALSTTKQYLLAELRALGYVFAANPGTGIVLLKSADTEVGKIAQAEDKAAL